MIIFLVSLAILAVIFLVLRYLFRSMTEDERWGARHGLGYPIRVVMGSLAFLLSLIETTVSLGVWIADV